MGQLEFGPSHDFFFSPSERDCYTPPPARWKCENPASLFFAGFPSPVERVENSFLAFGVSHAFHGASFPPRLPSRCARSAATRSVRSLVFCFSRPSPAFFRSWPKTELFSPKSCARVAKVRRSRGPSTQGISPWGSGFLPAALLAHGFAAQLDAMGVVHEAIQNAVGQGGIADLLVPLGHGQLAGQDGRARLIAVFTDFQEVPPLTFPQRRMRPIVHDQHVHAGQPSQPASQAAVGAGQSQLAK